MNNHERKVQTAIVYNASRADWHLYKIVDGAIGAKPFDIVGICQAGLGVAIEVKMKPDTRTPRTGQWPKLDPEDFSTHQRLWLSRYAEAGAVAIGAICYGEGNKDSTLLFYHWQQPMYYMDMSAVLQGGDDLIHWDRMYYWYLDKLRRNP